MDKERFAVIIPDRNDRPELIQHCLNQLSRMTIKPDKIFHVNWPPISAHIDLCERVYDAVMRAKEFGIDLVFIIENDDYYPANYFERFGDLNADFFGDDLTYYYHLKTRQYKSMYHPGRSSLFTTGFRISALGNFQWGGDVFLDMRLWEHAKKNKLKKMFVNTGAIGIKHGIGKCGGKGHRMKMQNCDTHMSWLKSRVDPESYLFYSEMSRKLWEKELAK
jgi:hypothetical protein